MKLTIHRGAKEIGGSCVEIQSGDSRILIDFGMPLVDSKKQPFDSKSIAGKSVEELKKKKILPDIKGLYRGEKPQIDAILISHSHLDHYGLLDFANDKIPVYISQGAKELVKVTNIFLNKNIKLTDTRIIKHKSPFNIKGFKITPYLVDHSAFDAFAFLIEAEGKRIFYSGDFRASGWKKSLFDRFIKNPPKNVNCLLMEGTTIERQDGAFVDEPAVLSSIQKVLGKTEANVLLAYCSGQNIDRIVTFYKAVRHAKATLIIDPYIATVLHVLKNERNTIPQLNWDNIKVLIGNYRGHGDIYINKIVKSNFKYLTFDIGRHKVKTWEVGREKCIVLMRDSMIPLIERIQGIKGITLIYSQWKGYIRDKKKTSAFWDFVHANNLTLEYIHTSGHAVLNDLQRFAKALSPKCLVPIHTFEAARYSEFFDNVKIVNDGEPFLI
jgi:ribonuclease J